MRLLAAVLEGEGHGGGEEEGEGHVHAGEQLLSVVLSLGGSESQRPTHVSPTCSTLVCLHNFDDFSLRLDLILIYSFSPEVGGGGGVGVSDPLLRGIPRECGRFTVWFCSLARSRGTRHESRYASQHTVPAPVWDHLGGRPGTAGTLEPS